MSSLLLRNGTVLLHQPDDSVKAHPKTDILIKGNKIDKVGASLTGDASTKVIDCSDKIVSPGFVDTHHHLWQTQLKGRCADEQLLQYFVSGNMQSYNYTPNDIYWGQLGGCLEALNAGTTTVVDHASLTYSTDHVDKAISATSSSGIRSIFCYNPVMRLKSWTAELVPEDEILPTWLIEQYDKLARSQPFGDGRVSIGFGFDFFFLPKDVVVSLFEKVRAAGAKLITSHFARNPVVGKGKNSAPVVLESYGLLGDDLLFSHATGATEDECKLMTKSNSYISCTPETEGQMLGSTPLAVRKNVLASIGVDCHSNNSSSIMEQMRLALFSARLLSNYELEKEGKFPKKIKGTSEEAFNLGTIHGARAVKMADQIGSIAEGKLADLVIFNTTSPSMINAAQHDPIVAIVRHAGIHDVSEVIVDGIPRKSYSSLNPVTAGAGAAVKESQELSWELVAKELIRSREEIQKRIDKLDIPAAVAKMQDVMHIDKSDFVDVDD